jgi:hypothetical protein
MRFGIMQRLIAVVGVLMIGFGLAMADDVKGKIKLVDGDKLVVTVGAKKGTPGEDKTFVVPASAKVCKGNFNKDTKKVEAGDALDGGMKNEMVKVGAFVTLTVDNDKVSQVIVSGGKKKKTE